MIGFIAAERREFEGLLRHLKNVSKLGLQVKWAVAGELNGNSVVLAANGPGPALAGRAADAVKEHDSLEALVSYGFCGALDSALALNDVFVATDVLSPRGAGIPACRVSGRSQPVPAGKLLSLAHVVCTSSEKSELRKTGAHAVEMEAGAIASRAQAWNLPFYCIRVVTDTAREQFSIDFNGVRDSAGRFSRSKIIAAALRNPLKLVPELIGLDARTRSASKVLGDFVAGCEF